MMTNFELREKAAINASKMISQFPAIAGVSEAQCKYAEKIRREFFERSLVFLTGLSLGYLYRSNDDLKPLSADCKDACKPYGNVVLKFIGAMMSQTSASFWLDTAKDQSWARLAAKYMDGTGIVAEKAKAAIFARNAADYLAMYRANASAEEIADCIAKQPWA